MPRCVKSQINEHVHLLLAAVHALRLRLSNNTKFSLVKVVSTVVQILVCQFAQRLILGYQWYVWWWQRQAWKNSGNTPNVSYRLWVALFHWVGLPGVCILQTKTLGISDKSGQLFFILFIYIMSRLMVREHCEGLNGNTTKLSFNIYSNIRWKVVFFTHWFLLPRLYKTDLIAFPMYFNSSRKRNTKHEPTSKAKHTHTHTTHSVMPQRVKNTRKTYIN